MMWENNAKTRYVLNISYILIFWNDKSMAPFRKYETFSYIRNGFVRKVWKISLRYS